MLLFGGAGHQRTGQLVQVHNRLPAIFVSRSAAESSPKIAVPASAESDWLVASLNPCPAKVARAQLRCGNEPSALVAPRLHRDALVPIIVPIARLRSAPYPARRQALFQRPVQHDRRRGRGPFPGGARPVAASDEVRSCCRGPSLCARCPGAGWAFFSCLKVRRSQAKQFETPPLSVRPGAFKLMQLRVCSNCEQTMRICPNWVPPHGSVSTACSPHWLASNRLGGG